MKFNCSFLILLLSLLTTPAMAEDDWWFDVEVIIFSRDHSQVQEKFSEVVHPIDVQDATDILSPYLWPDISPFQQMLPICNQLQPVEPPLFTPRSLDDLTTSAIANTNELLAGEMSTPTADLDPVVYDFNVRDWQQLLRVDCMPEPSIQSLFEPAAPHAFIAQVPVKINSIGHRYPASTHLISQQDLQLAKIYQQIYRQRDLQPMLHLGWRQQVVFGKDNAKNLRLFAGKNFSEEFNYWGKPLPKATQDDPTILAEQTMNMGETDIDVNRLATEPLDVITRIQQALAAPERSVAIEKQEQFVQQEFTGKLPEDVWQLDGLFKVYLQNINGVPYLHVDSQFNYRYSDVLSHTATAITPSSTIVNNPTTAPSQLMAADQQQPDLFLYSVPFNQLRRVISTQVHYFDHPYFGMVVQIRRYNVPEREEDE
ncbi:CsiV family protein [Alteromonadaceae bacterium BrNp21-10]|nr:CsiV family protein [Alteromonadaceae bacterium BrNp21-10]